MDGYVHGVHQGRIDRISNQGNIVISAESASGGKEVTVRTGNRDMDSFKPGDEVMYKLDDHDSTSGYVYDDHGYQGSRLEGDQGGRQVDVGDTGKDNPSWRHHAGRSAGKTRPESETSKNPSNRK